MKANLILIFLFMFSAASAFADCQEQMSQYVIRGDHASQAVGARLWDLEKLKKAAKEDSVCASSLYVQGFKEMNEYWMHIGKKKGCFDDKGALAKSATCTDEILANVSENLTYMKLVRLEDKLKDCQSCQLQSGVISQANAENIKEILAVAQAGSKPASPGVDQCAGVAKSDLVKPGEDSSFLDGKAWDCAVGGVKGFFKDGLVGLVKSAGNFVTSWFGIPGLVDLFTQLATDPVRTMVQLKKNIAHSLYQKFAARYDKWACYNSDKKAEVFCSSIGQGGFIVIETIAGLRLGRMAIEAMQAAKKAPYLNVIPQPALGYTEKLALPAPGATPVPAPTLALPAPAASAASAATAAQTGTGTAAATSTGAAASTSAAAAATKEAAAATASTGSGSVITVGTDGVATTASQEALKQTAKASAEATKAAKPQAPAPSSAAQSSSSTVGRQVEVPKGKYDADAGLRIKQKLQNGQVTRKQLEEQLSNLQQQANELELKMRMGQYDQAYLQKLRGELQKKQNEVTTLDQVLDQGTGKHLRTNKPAPTPTPEYRGTPTNQQVSNYRSKIKDKSESYVATEKQRLKDLDAQHTEKLRKMVSEGESKSSIARQEKVRNDIRDQMQSLEKAEAEARSKRWEKGATAPESHP